MSDVEIEAAALSDPDNQPTGRGQPMRRLAFVRFVRQQLGLTVEEFAGTYGIPAVVVEGWERHEIEPTAAEISFLKAIAQAPDVIREALAAA